MVSDKARLRQAALRRRDNAYRPGTQANRWSHALLFIAFTQYFNLTDFPATAISLMLFAEFLLRSYRAHKSVTNALSSLRTFHKICGFSDLAFDHFQLTQWRRALPLTVRSVPRPAPGCPFSLLVRLCSHAGGLGPRGRTFAALAATAFFSLARLSSLVPTGPGATDTTRVPLLRDLVFSQGKALLRIKWGKTAQGPGEGFWVPLRPVPHSEACPVRLLTDLLQSLVGFPSTTPLFSFRAGRGSRFLRHFNAREARGFLNDLLLVLGSGGLGFTFHSFRRGGCSLAFEGGANLADLQLLGGWKSRAIDSYYPNLLARDRAAAVLSSIATVTTIT